MCGFTGFIDYSGIGNQDVLRKMTDTLYHRGPDDAGYELLPVGGCNIGLGFRRLSIIDLSPLGHQPMFSSSREIVVMMNGEIYNYKEIKSELISQGASFRSGSDTEVVVEGFRLHGIDIINKFIGMFVITILDIKNQELYFVRDRAGVKPLYYSVSSNGFVFGSELKALKQFPGFNTDVDEDALALYFSNGNIPAPYSIYKGCKKVEPGTYIKINLSNRDFSITKYWDVFDSYNAPNYSISYEEALYETEKLMESAFAYRMVADVPVGVFLSGGYDSTAVAALLTKSYGKINTYTIGFEENNYDESPYAKIVADHLGTNHFNYNCTINDAKSIIPELADIYDEPFGDSSAIPTILVSRVARKHVTVALSADAGDELFAGYPRHRKASDYLSKLNSVPNFIKQLSLIGQSVNFSKNISKANRLDKIIEIAKSNGPLAAFNVINRTFTLNEINLLMGNNSNSLHTVFDDDSLLSNKVSILNKVLAVEYKSYLVDDILQKVDRATMSASLEGREPFLDHRLVEYVAKLPDSYKLHNGVGKRILKDIVHKYVPKEMMDRPKMGFGVPVVQWMKSDLRDLLEETINESVLKDQNHLDSKMVMKIKNDYLNGNLVDFERLWFVFTYLQWFKKSRQ
ncbi:MAG TPA: asparagine synthase (glutamine-hydrolyzing) [Bacteroidia bacterium]|nr:asparagine synthase (glutamine-hydrolyzing) [Bacteroidia bacterium]